MSVSRLIQDSCRRFAERTALITLRDEAATAAAPSAVELSYGELLERTLRLADALMRQGVAPGDRLAVLLDNGPDLIITEWACLLSGIVWVALNVRSSAEELQVITDDCTPSALVTAARFQSQAAGLRLPPGCRRYGTGRDGQWEELLASGRPQPPAREPTAEQPVRIRYTSGTAGRPKGAVLARRSYDASVEAVADVIGPLAGGDTLLQVAPMTHASGAMLLPHVRVGARSVLASRFDVAGLVEVVERFAVSAVFLVPTMLVRLLDGLDDPARLKSLRTIVYGGASMPVDRLIDGLAKLGRRFVQIYGLTESTWPVIALKREDHALRRDTAARARLASCGRPTAIGDVRIVGSGGAECRARQAGELWVRGRNTMLGYWQGGQIVAGADGKGLDEQGWMHTGDVGFRDQDGFITIVDRLHDMIVSGGFNVYPREVEDALARHPAVLESAVVGLPDSEWGERVHASVVLRSGVRAAVEDLAAHCARHVAGYKKPRSIEIVDDLPKNPAGKILRREVRRRMLGRAAQRR